MSSQAYAELCAAFGPKHAIEALWAFTAFPFASAAVVLEQARAVISRATGGSIEALFRELHEETMREMDRALDEMHEREARA